MERQYIVLVKDGDPAVARILEGIGKLTNVEVNRTAPPKQQDAHTRGEGCKCCGLIVEKDTLEWHGNLGGMVCMLCINAHDLVIAKWQHALNRHSAEFFGQLEQMVRDVRAGHDSPTFYQGFE